MHEDGQVEPAPGPRRPARPTLRDVAARAGVSPSTASLAFSGSGPVAGATRERVLAAAEELGWAGPDPLARSLRRRRNGVVGAVVGERLRTAFSDPVALTLLDGLADELGPAGCSLLLLPGRTDGYGPSPEQVGAMAMDAAVFATCGGEDDPAVDRLLDRGVPVVGVEGPHRDDVPIVDLDNRGASTDLARHLHGLGHRRVAVLTLPLRLDGRCGPVDDDRRDAAAFADSRDRLAGVRDVFPGAAAVEAPGNVVEHGRQAATQLLSTGPRPTAVVAQSDLLAVGVVMAARDAGLAVPGDLAVTGFDGIETPWLGDLVLTTVVQPAQEKGRVAGRMVIELLAGGRPADVLLPVHLRLGGSTCPPAPG